MARTRATHISKALKPNSRLRRLVRVELQALASSHAALIALEQRSRVGDSLDLNAAAKDEHPQENRWDYIISVPDIEQLVGIEPHSAKDSELAVVIAKKKYAADYLRNHLAQGNRVTRWLWVSPGPVGFGKMEQARRQLDQNGIEFVGRLLRMF